MTVTVGDSGLCCCTCVMYFERKLTRLFVDLYLSVMGLKELKEVTEVEGRAETWS